MKILILGHARHGKDTVAELLRYKLGLSFTSSSMAALDVIYPALQAIRRDFAQEEYSCESAAFNNRVHCRDTWKELISLYNTPDKSALCKKILAENDMYVGMRCQKEYDATRKLFSHIVWVEATDRCPDRDPTMTIAFDPRWMDVIYNNGSLEELSLAVDNYIEYCL